MGMMMDLTSGPLLALRKDASMACSTVARKDENLDVEKGSR